MREIMQTALVWICGVLPASMTPAANSRAGGFLIRPAIGPGADGGDGSSRESNRP
jgi:hypothetical protein